MSSARLERLVSRLRALDVSVWVEDERLHYDGPPEAIDDALLDELAANKAELVALLQGVLDDTVQERAPIEPVPRDGFLPLSYAQQRLWFLEQLSPGTAAYHVPLAMAIDGELSRAALTEAVNVVVARHEPLRTRFAERDGMPQQVIEAASPVEIPLLDLRHLDDERRGREITRQMETEATRSFDLSRGPLLRCRLLRTGDREHILLLTMHHIVSDGWSMGVLFRELGTCYGAIVRGEPPRLAPLGVQYADFAAWQRSWLAESELERQTRYWTDRLQGLSSLELPLDRRRPATPSYLGGIEIRDIAPGLRAKLDALSRESGATLFMTLLTGFAILLRRYSGQDDLVVGSPIANRNHPDIENLIGFFVNMLVLRIDADGEPTVRELLERVRRTTLEGYAHQDVPFEKLVEALAPERDLSRNPLFQIAFALQNASQESLDLEGLTLRQMPLAAVTTRFDLELHAWPQPDGLRFISFYRRDVLDATTVSRILAQLERLLAEMVAHPDARIDDLALLGPQERAGHATGLERPRTDYPREATVATLFTEQARRAPDAIALEMDGASVTYRELEHQTARWARRLRELGVGRDVAVGVMSTRGVDMVVAWLSVLRAGGAYVPLDPDHPASRLALMLEDSAAPVLLVQRALRGRLPAFDGPVLLLDEPPSGVGVADDVDDPARAQSLAYIMYTSGSTGVPKGVAVPNRAVVRLVRDTDYCQPTSADRIVQASNASFDAATFEVWGALLNGATLVGVPREVTLSPGAYAAFLARERISVMFVTTALFNQIAHELPKAFAGLRTVMFGGEAVDPSAVRKVLAGGGAPEHLLHVYGPTESTTFATWHRVRQVAEDAVTVPIGKPIANTSTYVLDSNRRPVPNGVPGELWLGGDGLAREYWRRPELTAERFVVDPFAAEPDARMYRTGDRVRVNVDGDIEFLGRIDHQVKIRGFRIELGEIEAALLDEAVVREAAVLCREDTPGDKRLVAYVAPDQRSIAAVTERSGSEHVGEWRSLYERLYGGDPESGDLGFDIVGWNSSYTGEPIPAPEMREWVEATVARIRRLGPRRVLEIGCGTGLLLARIAPHTERYVGTDFSAAAVARIRALAARDPSLAAVEALEREGRDFSGLASASFDTVVINSVTQYLPNVDYLIDVLERAATVVRPGGRIFVGDVRSLPMLPAYHAAVQLHRAADTDTAQALAERVERQLEQENELVVDPRLFHLVARRTPGLGSVDVMMKRGHAHNELTQFRYDVVIHVGEAAAAPAPRWIDWTAEAMTLERLEGLLTAADGDLGLAGVPNGRVAGAVATLGRLQEEQAGLDVATLRAQALAVTESAVEPEALWAMAANRGYRLEMTFGGRRGHDRMDALFRRAESVPDAAPYWPPTALDDDLTAAALATNPLRGKLAREVVPTLRDGLERRLPEYMVPSTFVLLEALPLNANGKLDRNALPRPQQSRELLGGNYQAPRDEVEARLAGIWAQLLGVDRVGVTDDFFDLGGHSLLATQVVSRVREAFGVELPLANLFGNATVESVARWLEQPTAASVATMPIERVSRDGPLPTSFSQERLWFVEQLADTGSAFHMCLAARLRGPLDLAALRRAVAALIERHETLRTTLPATEGRPWQAVAPSVPVPLEIERVADPSVLESRLSERIGRPFDLERGPLLDVWVGQLAAEDQALLVRIHHIVSDGWSLGILARELAALYRAEREGRPAALPALPIQYADFAAWQRRHLTDAVLAELVSFWRRRLDGLPTLAMPTDRPRPATLSYRGGAVIRDLPPGLSEAVEALARGEGATTFATLLAAFAAVLARHTGQDDLALGTTVAGRNRVEVEGLIGFFVNMLPLRLDVSGEPTARELIGRARDRALEALEHQALPFEKLVEALDPPRDLSRNPLFQVTFSVEKQFGSTTVALDGTEASRLLVGGDGTRFDLEVIVIEHPERPQLACVFSTDLFDDATVERLLGRFEHLLAAMVAAPDTRLGELPVLPAAEREQVLTGFNATTRDYGAGASIVEVIEAQARRTPDAIALEFEGRTLTFAAVESAANRLARELREQGVGRDTLVAVCMERSLELVVSLYAVIKAGGAYVPVDPEYPRERLEWMLADTGAPVVLTQSRLRSLVGEEPGRPVLAVDERLDALIATDGAVPSRDWPIGASDLAYVIYTSGSTGRPKGAMVEHASIRNRLLWMQETYGLDESDVVLQKTPYGFDVSVWEFFWPLMTGARLVVARPGGHRDGAYLVDLIRRRGVTTLHFVPSMLRVFLEEAGVERCTGLRRVVCSGEALGRELERRFRERLGCELHNLYGPTEAAVDVTWWQCAADGDDAAETVPIGRPVANTRMYVLDPRLEPVPIGVAGELHIGGIQVGRGYWRRPELSAERFVADPHVPGGRLYKTGDIARWRADGVLEYLGRVDDQVKIRGMRVELGEIESLLGEHPSVRQAVVVSRELGGDGATLVAYLLLGEEVDLQALRTWLAERVPAYMVPARWVRLDAVPLTPSGKVDRRALPEPDAAALESAPYRAPEGEVEETLAVIWREVLAVERIGRDDDFFALGGHSLLATQVVSRVRSLLGVELPVAGVFESPTVAALAARVDAARPATRVRRGVL
ncbi:MAG: amino acid adenylation domain-containing protein [Chromatiales bacterium]|nr:amino acid adenylation domain-containing protein [Chromatiales bacterium]